MSLCDLNETDPFEQVYIALWELVQRNPYFDATVLKVGNRIKYDKENSAKVNIAHADTPELQLLLGPMSDFTMDCSSRGITKTYVWGLATGEKRRGLHNKVSFELFRSMIDYHSTLCKLTWCGCTFVVDAQIASEDIGQQMQDMNREVNGWSSLLGIEVKFQFPFKKLKVVEETT